MPDQPSVAATITPLTMQETLDFEQDDQVRLRRKRDLLKEELEIVEADLAVSVARSKQLRRKLEEAGNPS